MSMKRNGKTSSSTIIISELGLLPQGSTYANRIPVFGFMGESPARLLASP